MKTIFYTLSFIIILSAFSNESNAQIEEVHKLKSNVIKLEADYLDVKIKTWDKNYVKVESQIIINSQEGSKNHDLQMKNGVEGVVIKSIVDTEGIETMVIATDKDGNKKFISPSLWDETKDRKNFKDINIGYEIDGSVTVLAPKGMMLEVKTQYSDVVIEGGYEQIETCSTYGMIEAKLEDVSDMKKVSFVSTYDFVDLTLDKNSDVTLKLNSSYGSVFSDLPLESKSIHPKSNNCTNSVEKYVMNDGTVPIDIIATYDNIYVRSGQ